MYVLFPSFASQISVHGMQSLQIKLLVDYNIQWSFLVDTEWCVVAVLAGLKTFSTGGTGAINLFIW
jgi:hypothetical protein